MAIKRGVSLYSYQQAYLKGDLDLEGCIRTVVESANADGIELIYEQMPVERYPDAVYPDISEAGIDRWKGWMDQYKTRPTCMDSFINYRLYNTRELTVAEQVQRMAKDLKLASQLGFYCIRVLSCVRPEVIEASIPAAEQYGVVMGQEIHAPLMITDQWIQNIVEMRQRKNTKYVALIPDFGIFQKGVSAAELNLARMMGESSKVVDYVSENLLKSTPVDEIEEKAKSMGSGKYIDHILMLARRMNRYNDPELLRDIADSIVHFHGKFNRIDKNYEELTINYKDPIRILKEVGWDGYIASEFEGQRAYHVQDCPYEEDEIEQVRRHHVMMQKYIDA